MDAQLEIKLIECLSLLEQGEPLDRILARFPDDTASLRPLLETAEALSTMRMEPSEHARVASRRAFLNQAAERRATLPRSFLLTRRLAIAVGALVLAIAFASGTVSASASALPNQTLYPVKRAVEDVQLMLAAGTARSELVGRFEQRRRDEVRALIADGEAAAVAFDGSLDAIQGDRWMVSGVVIRVTPATRISGTPMIGWRVNVQGRTASGQFSATSIDIVPNSGPPPTATPTHTPQPTATHTPQPTATHTPTPAPTATPQPVPTAPPPTQPAVPTKAPQPAQEIEFGGVVENVGRAWTVDGTRFEVNNQTEIRGQIGVGDHVKVRAVRLVDGRLIARRIEREDEGSNDQNTNRNDNSGDDHGGDGGSDSQNDNSGDDHGGTSGGDDHSGGGSQNDNSGGDDHGGTSGGGQNDNSGGDDHGGTSGGDDHSGGGGDHGGSDDSHSGGGKDDSK
jgi:uncharacterized membrane protein YgcG